MSHLRTHLPDLQLVVHRGFNTNRVRVGDTRVVPLQPFARLLRLRVKELNEQWRRLDDYAVEAGGALEIDLTGGGYTSFDEHPWGPFYVHYTMDYYRDFLAELNLIHLRRSLARSGRTVELLMLDQAREAVTARADLLVERKARRIARLRRACGEAREAGRRLPGGVGGARRTSHGWAQGQGQGGPSAATALALAPTPPSSGPALTILRSADLGGSR